MTKEQQAAENEALRQRVFELEARLAKSEDRLRWIMESSPEGREHATKAIENKQGGAVKISSSPVPDSDGGYFSGIHIIHDIREHALLQKMLAERKNFLKSVFNSIQDGITILNKDLTILEVNQTIEEIYPHDIPLKGKKCYKAYHNRQSPCEPCPARQTLDTGLKATAVISIVHPDGRRKWRELFSFPLKDVATGELLGIINLKFPWSMDEIH